MDTQEKGNGKLPLSTNQVIKWLVSALGFVSVFLLGEAVKSLDGLHAEYGAMMKEVDELAKEQSAQRAQHELEARDLADVKAQLNEHLADSLRRQK